LVTTWNGDLSSLINVFKQLAAQLFLKPGFDSFSSTLSGLLQGLVKGGAGSGGLESVNVTPDVFGNYSGAHAGGGTIDPGKWGIVGEEGPELARGGVGGMTIYPNKSGPGMGGNTVNQYITTPDANSFKANKRQVARAGRAALGV